MAETPSPHPREADRLIYVGLLGLAAAGVLQFADKEAMDVPLMAAAYCFAAAMPLLAAGLITDYARRAGVDVPRWRDGVGILGAVAAVAGMGAVLLHFGPGVFGVFAAGCVVGFVLVRRQ